MRRRSLPRDLPSTRVVFEINAEVLKVEGAFIAKVPAIPRMHGSAWIPDIDLGQESRNLRQKCQLRRDNESGALAL